MCGRCDYFVIYFRFTYEIAPVFTLMEDIVLSKMRELVGWPNGEGDGIFAPGPLLFPLYNIRTLSFIAL